MIHDIDIAESQTERTQNCAGIFEKINNDCLREIIKYLNIFEVEKLAATCTKLQTFSNDFIYPKIARKMEIRFNQVSGFDRIERYGTFYTNDFQRPFESFGSCIEQVTFIGINFGPTSQLLRLCSNLHTLRMRYYYFNSGDSKILNHVAPSIKILKLECCSGNEDDWSETLKRLPNVEHITLTGRNKITANLFKREKKLSSLTIDYRSLSSGNDLENIFDHNGKTIQQLKLFNFTESPNYQSIRTLILDKLPKLENLAIEDTLSFKLTNLLTELPYLRSLKVTCTYYESVNSLMRTLSDLGTIEELDIEKGVFETEDENAPPLIFNQLRTVSCDSLTIVSALTKSHMPAITCFQFDLLEDAMCILLTLFISKKTLKSMHVFCWAWTNVERNRFALEIISILRRNMNRPYLNLKIHMLSINAELVSKIISKIYSLSDMSLVLFFSR